jgi:predicted RND superfamily exporter protein
MSDFFGRIADVGLHAPKRVVAVGVLVLAVCGAFAGQLGIDSSRHSMVSPDNPHQALQVAYFERFGLPDTLVLVLQGGTAAEQRAVARAFVDDLEAEPMFRGRIVAQLAPEALAELFYLNPVPPSDPANGANPGPKPPEGVDAEGWLVSPDGVARYVMVSPEIPGTQQVHEVEPVVARVRAARDKALARGGGSVHADLTGQAVLVVDEQAEIQRGIVTTSGVTAGAILLLLWLAFRSLRYTLLALLPVVVGATATMAAARLLYGGLNMVTSSASSILLGLGIDFGVFLLSRYGELLRAGTGRQEAIRETLRRSGLALVVGSGTTALAFLTTTLTEFTAYARLGVIVALGLLFMVVATLLLIPALLELTGRRRVVTPPQLHGVTFLPGLARWHPAVVVVVAAGLAVAGFAGAGTLQFNTRFYDFIPGEVEGARALRAIESVPLVTPLRATVPVEGIEPARALTAALRALPSVAAVQSPTDILPPLDLDALRARVAVPPPPGSPAPLVRAWTTAKAIADRGGYVPNDLPPLLRHQFVSRDGQAVGLQVIPRGDVWDPAVAATFAAEVGRVAPQATGMAMHIDAHLRFIREGFTWAALLAALLVAVAVFVAFRNARDTLLALTPLAMGFGWMLGTMALAGVRFDAANIVVLPLILGIGVDAGVHLVERARQSKAEHGVARLDDIVLGTGSAVALASITTFVGFAALMLADYGAMFSLGRLMTLGVGGTIIASLWVLPALLVWTGRAK